MFLEKGINSRHYSFKTNLNPFPLSVLKIGVGSRNRSTLRQRPNAIVGLGGGADNVPESLQRTNWTRTDAPSNNTRTITLKVECTLDAFRYVTNLYATKTVEGVA